MLNYKTVIVLKLVQYHLILANSAYGLVGKLPGDTALAFALKLFNIYIYIYIYIAEFFKTWLMKIAAISLKKKLEQGFLWTPNSPKFTDNRKKSRRKKTSSSVLLLYCKLYTKNNEKHTPTRLLRGTWFSKI